MFSSKQNAAPLGHECDRNCRPRVSPGTHRQQKGAKTSPKGAAQHSQATERGINVVQGCRPALTGNEKGRKRHPRVPPGTHRRQKGAKTSPKGAARHSQATKRGINVAQGCRPALTGNEKTKRGKNAAQGCRPALTGDRKSLKRCPRVSPGTHRQQKGAKTPLIGAALSAGDDCGRKHRR